MQKAYLHMVKYFLDKQCTISVYDGEIWEVKRSTSYKAIKDCIESVEEAQIRVRNSEGVLVGWALIIPHGMQPDETVADYNCNETMESWENSYNETLSNN